MKEIHQSNICVCCDRFIIGTEELNWISKKSLLTNKRRLINPDVTNESLRACYRVGDDDLKELLLSPRARVKLSGEFMCCLQCYKSLKDEKLDKNPPKFAISNHFAIGNLPEMLTLIITEINIHFYQL